MRNRILGGIGMLWGGFMVAGWLLGDPSQAVENGTAAYATGYAVGRGFAHVSGWLMLFAGLYFCFKKPKQSPSA